MRPHGRARVDSRSPRAWAICDRCGFLYNHYDLNWQYDWRGAQLQNLRKLVCERCMDKPQEQQRTIVLPADPTPVLNSRPENYTAADNPQSSIGTAIGSMTQYGGVAAAFDSNINKPIQASAATLTSAAGFNNSVGISWGANNSQIVTRFTLYAPNNAPFLAGSTTYKFQGANNTLVWTDIFGGTTTGVNAEIIDVTTIVLQTSYLYHRVVFFGDSFNTVSIAQCIFYVLGTGNEP